MKSNVLVTNIDKWERGKCFHNCDEGWMVCLWRLLTPLTNIERTDFISIIEWSAIKVSQSQANNLLSCNKGSHNRDGGLEI